jgi:hypothetical protein
VPSFVLLFSLPLSLERSHAFFEKHIGISLSSSQLLYTRKGHVETSKSPARSVLSSGAVSPCAQHGVRSRAFFLFLFDQPKCEKLLQAHLATVFKLQRRKCFVDRGMRAGYGAALHCG